MEHLPSGYVFHLGEIGTVKKSMKYEARCVAHELPQDRKIAGPSVTYIYRRWCYRGDLSWHNVVFGVGRLCEDNGGFAALVKWTKRHYSDGLPKVLIDLKRARKSKISEDRLVLFVRNIIKKCGWKIIREHPIYKR